MDEYSALRSLTSAETAPKIDPEFDEFAESSESTGKIGKNSRFAIAEIAARFAK